MKQKRYEFWTFENGKPVKKFTDWFDYDGEEFPYQFEASSKTRRLLNEYRNI